MPSTEITSCKQFEDLLSDRENTKQYVVVDFYGNNCPPCIQFAPTFEKLADQYNDTVHFVKINIFNNKVSDIAEDLEIRKIPTFMFFKVGNGEPIENSIGGKALIGPSMAEEVIQCTLNGYLPSPVNSDLPSPVNSDLPSPSLLDSDLSSPSLLDSDISNKTVNITEDF